MADAQAGVRRVDACAAVVAVDGRDVYTALAASGAELSRLVEESRS